MIKQHNSPHKTPSKQKRHLFIPFQNQRDNLGRIIKPRSQQKNNCNILQLFENLKKSTKEYFFEKQFQKMSKKFNNVKKSLDDDKEYNYEKQVDQCIDLVDNLMYKKEIGEKNKQNLYINLREKIDNKINGVRSGLKKIRCVNYNNSKSQSQYILKDVQQSPKNINVELFKTLSARAEMMATFCSTGLKYTSLVQKKKFDPWRKWYRKCEFQVFPGKKVGVKCLQKSIYQ